MHTVCISAITAGELAFGLAKRPQATSLKAAVDEFLRRV
jgi:tRNA(fMet)-specific endonuclease VapC